MLSGCLYYVCVPNEKGQIKPKERKRGKVAAGRKANTEAYIPTLTGVFPTLWLVADR